MKALEKFIKENGLTFIGEGSNLNSDCCVLAGYADHLGVDRASTLISVVKRVEPSATGFEDELTRVFEFAYSNNYGIFWKTKEARHAYHF